MANQYTQEVILDADGKPILDAFKNVQTFIDNIQRSITQIGAKTKEDAKAWGVELGKNLAALRQAEADLKALQAPGRNRAKGFEDANRALKQNLTEEGRANKEANSQRLAESKAYYGEKTSLTRKSANEQKVLDREIAEYERSLDRAAIASSKEVAAARREAAQAGVIAKARGLSDPNDIRGAKSASDQRLSLLRREREVTAANDSEGAKNIGYRIELEKKLGRELDLVAGKLEKNVTLTQRTGFAAQKALAPTRAALQAELTSPADALVRARMEQGLASRGLSSSLVGSTPEQITLARQRLELANANVAAARNLVREEDKLLTIDRQLATVRTTEGERARLSLAGQYARVQVETLGPVEALKRATQERIALEERLLMVEREGTAEQVRQARVAKELAVARESSIGKMQAKPSAISNILTPGYAGAAIARTALYGVAAGGAYAAFGAVSGAISGVVELEDELKKLQAIANASDTQMRSLTNSILQVGQDSRFSLVELAKISQVLAQAGVSVGDMTKVLGSVTTLANASGSTPDEAVNLVTAALGSFQLQASEAARVADLMTSALNRTKLTVAQTGQAIQYVGATAYEQNIPLEQLLATVASVAQAGVRSGSTIGTGFRQFLVDLQDPSKKLTEQLSALGLTQADVNVKTKGLSAVLDTLKSAGFGAAQAYGGLETRAAAFYLAAKNNIDVSDQLQLAFQDSGAAAAANERAMNSLTAQWQRFKNILGAQFAKDMAPVIDFLKTSLRDLGTYLEEFNKKQEETSRRMAGGYSGYVKRAGGSQLMGALAYENDNFLPDLSKTITQESALEKSFNRFFYGIREAKAGLHDYGTEILDTNDKINNQQGSLDELRKEYVRLLTQKDSLIDNDQRSAAEMSNLMGRFQGLSGYLTNTKNQYTDLTNAVKGFIQAQADTLQGTLATQNSNLANDSNRLRNARGGFYSAVTKNADFSKLTPSEAAAVRSVTSAAPGGDEFRRATVIIADAAARLANNTNGLGSALNNLAQNMGEGQNNVSQRRVLGVQRAQAAGSATNQGSEIQAQSANIEALIARAQGGDKGATGQATAALNRADAYLASFVPKPEYRQFFNDAKDDLKSFRAQVKAILTPTEAEAKSSLRESRTAAREAERVARQGPPVTQASVDSILRTFGLGFGRGHDDSPAAKAAENRLHAAGKTRATGDTSGHTMTGGIARDLQVGNMSQADRVTMANSIRSALKNAGVDAYVKYESGEGKNNGTGPHIHVSVRPGARRGGPVNESDRVDNQLAQQEERRQRALASNQLAIDKAALRTTFSDVAKAQDPDSFKAALAAAQLSLLKVNKDLLDAATAELASQGIGPESPEYAEKLRQVQEQIAQNAAEFQGNAAEAIIKNLKAGLVSAQVAFNEAMAPAEAAKAIADARVSGLSLASNDGRVPDYISVLAQKRAAQAAESVQRTRAGQLPGLITAETGRLDAASMSLEQLDKTSASYAAAKEEVHQLTVALAELKNEKLSLDATLSAGEQIPLTLADGLSKAIEAYKETHQLNNTFSQDLILNMGGALETVHNGLTSFFTDVVTGSKSVLGAFGDFALSMAKYLQQLAAQFIANQIFKVILGLVGTAVGGSVSVGVGASGAGYNAAAFKGGSMDPENPHYAGKGYISGGAVSNGSPVQDSVRARLAKGEWVVQKKAVDSVGHEFMAQLNNHGSKALDRTNSMAIMKSTKQEANVYIVAPDQKPSLGRNDVLVVMQDELLNGESRKLVHQISQGA